MEQWLGSGVFLVDVSGSRELCIAWSLLRGVLSCQLYDGRVHRGTVRDVHISWPALGWVTMSTRVPAHVLRRSVPGSRTYTRVPCPGSLEWAAPVSVDDGCSLEEISAPRVEYRNLFFPEYPTTMEAATETLRRDGAVALSPSCCVVGGHFLVGRVAVARVFVDGGIRASAVETPSPYGKLVRKALSALEGGRTWREQ